MNKISKIALISFCLTPFCGYAQNIDLVLSEEQPEYELIVDVQVSSSVYADDPVSDYEAGHRYRLIITRARIFESLYIEKQILNVEGGVYKTDWSKKIDMFDLVDKLEISPEQMVFKAPNWVDVATFTVKLSNKKIKINIKQDGSVNAQVLE